MPNKTPMLNSPFSEPTRHWQVAPGASPVLVEARRPATYLHSLQGGRGASAPDAARARPIELVERIRAALPEWRKEIDEGGGGITRTTRELLRHWRREDRRVPLFFAQLEAAETVIFLAEAGPAHLHGIDVPTDKASDAEMKALVRQCLKLATGGGKTVVMGMLAAWSILNKADNPMDARFSKRVLAVCPNLIIKDRLGVLDPRKGRGSIYHDKDLVPTMRMDDLKRGSVLVLNWHQFMRRELAGGVDSRGKKIFKSEKIKIGDGTRSVSQEEYARQRDLGLLRVIEELRDKSGTLTGAIVHVAARMESYTAWKRRLFSDAFGDNWGNILVFNDEAHHAWRGLLTGQGDVLEGREQSTVWIDGLDLLNQREGILKCIDFSATPYYLAPGALESNSIFPWTVSNFGLEDAIESGIVKIPELFFRDDRGKNRTGFSNLWDHILKKHREEKGAEAAAGGIPDEDALKHASRPLAAVLSDWEKTRQKWSKEGEAREPVLIIICNSISLAETVHKWVSGLHAPEGMPRQGISSLHNESGKIRTFCAHSKVDQVDSESGISAKEWMRIMLDTAGKAEWPTDSQGAPIYPSGFEGMLAEIEGKKHPGVRSEWRDVPPGQSVRCVVSVSMLTEGWDCPTVTHVVGMRQFGSQLLCEQVIGRALRRRSYEIASSGENGAPAMFREETACVLGVPMMAYPVKMPDGEEGEEQPERVLVHAVQSHASEHEIRFPIVEGYERGRIVRMACDWAQTGHVSVGTEDSEYEMGKAFPTNDGLAASGGSERVLTLSQAMANQSVQHETFRVAAELVNHCGQGFSPTERLSLFNQAKGIVAEFLRDHVNLERNGEFGHVFFNPYRQNMVDALKAGISALHEDGREMPRISPRTPEGSTAEVHFPTSRPVYRDLKKSHINVVVCDTESLEQQTAFHLDNSDMVETFSKTDGTSMRIPYVWQGKERIYKPDFLIRLIGGISLVLETKGYDEKKGAKMAAGNRWAAAVTEMGGYGVWKYAMASDVGEVRAALEKALE